MARGLSRKWKFGGAVAVVVVVGIAWVLFSPLLFDEVVEEAFPGVPTRESLAAMSPEQKDAMAQSVLAAAATMPDHAMAETMPTATGDQPVLVSQGAFADADAVHRGAGGAGIYTVAGGCRILRLEELRVTNGPDLRVVLVRNADPKSSADVRDDYFDLGPLKGNVGNQDYQIPAAVDLSQYGSVAMVQGIQGAVLGRAAAGRGLRRQDGSILPPLTDGETTAPHRRRCAVGLDPPIAERESTNGNPRP